MIKKGVLTEIEIKIVRSLVDKLKKVEIPLFNGPQTSLTSQQLFFEHQNILMAVINNI